MSCTFKFRSFGLFLYAVTNYTTIVKRNAAFQKRENAQITPADAGVDH